jgi:phosphatidylglycerol:prolipoprotein diacylglycerol transferase
MDPYIIEVGSFRVGYYGLMYIVGFAVVYVLALWRSGREGFGYNRAFIQNYIYWGALGLIIGARVGYVVFYSPGYYFSHPLEIFFPFDLKGGFRFTGIAGMSYHGGAIGLVAASVIYLRRYGEGFWRFADFIVPAFPLGYAFGRVGNFINGELYGRVTTVSWGMYFPLDPQRLLRHPSQLYEALGEGVFLFALLWSLRNKRPFEGFIPAVYLIGYGGVRFFIEYFREPDVHLGFVLGPFSMGQVLCLVMVLAGGGLIAVKGRSVRA